MPIQLGTWQRKANMLAITLDNFELILMMEFLKTIKAAIVPHLSSLFIMDGKNPCVYEKCLKKEER